MGVFFSAITSGKRWDAYFDEKTWTKNPQVTKGDKAGAYIFLILSILLTLLIFGLLGYGGSASEGELLFLLILALVSTFFMTLSMYFLTRHLKL